MSDYRVLPCRRCGHIWKWAADKKSVPYCPDGYGCANKKENQMTDLCPFCREPLDCPYGYGCAAMIKHAPRQQSTIYGELELQADADGIWLVDAGSKHGTFQMGHVPWQTIAIYIKEYL